MFYNSVEAIMKKINKYLDMAIKFCLFTFLFFLLFNASINQILYPFAFGMLFALTWANQKVYLLAPAYLLAGLITDFSLENAIVLLVTIFVLIVPYFIHVLCKKVMRKWEFGIYAVLSQIGKVIFEILGGFSPILSVVNVVLGVLYLYLAIVIFEALIIRGFSNKLTSLELVSLFVLVMSLCAGFVNLNIESFSFLKLFVSFLILVFAYTSSPILTLLLAITAGVGALIATNNPLYMTPFVLWAMSALMFKNHHKIFMVIGVLCVEVLIGYYFQLYYSFGIIEALPLIISSVVFFCLPKAWLNEVSVVFNLSKDRLAMKNVVNRNREILHQRLGNLAEVFNDMNIIYRNMLKKGMSQEDVKKILNEEICDKICSYCPERNHCHRTFAENTHKVFDELITIAFERGKVNLLDIPSYLTSRCKQTSAILGAVNTLTTQYKKYLTMLTDVDTSKTIIADQLLGISKVISALSKEVESNVSFDSVRENKILDELTYHNIICIDAVVFEKDIHDITDQDKEDIGVVLSDSGFSGYLTIQDILPILRNLYKRFDETLFLKQVHRFQLPLDKKIKDFSTGMKAKLKVLVACTHNARLLILDEPTAGLDVIARDELLEILREYMEADETRSILISSHISSDLESLCDDIYMIHEGKIIMHEETDVLLSDYALLKLDEDQFEKLDQQYILRFKKESYGYSALTNQKQFYIENYPSIVIEKSTIDEIITMMVRGKEK